MFIGAGLSLTESVLREAKRSSDKARKLLRGLGIPVGRVSIDTSVV